MSNTTTAADTLVTAYLAELRTAVAGLPGADDLVADITEHIEIARAELDSQRPGDIEAILDRLGTPAEIAAAAGADAAIRRPGTFAYLGLAACFAACLVPVAGPLAALTMISLSRGWSRGQRAFAWVMAFAPLTLLTVVFAVTDGTIKPWHLTLGVFALVPLGTLLAGFILAVQLRLRSR
jgi:hypothetical protein